MIELILIIMFLTIIMIVGLPLVAVSAATKSLAPLLKPLGTAALAIYIVIWIGAIVFGVVTTKGKDRREFLIDTGKKILAFSFLIAAVFFGPRFLAMIADFVFSLFGK